MSQSTMTLDVPVGTGARQITALLGEYAAVVLVPGETFTRVFYDTFDWALFAAGDALATWPQAAALRLFRIPLDGLSPMASQAISGEPGFASDLPPGVVRDVILPHCGIRRLLPVVAVECHVTPVQLVNDQHQVLLRVEIAEQTALQPGGEVCARLSTRLHLSTDAHHENVLRDVRSLLHERLGPADTKIPLLVQALAACGRRPGGSDKTIEQLDPSQRSDDALKRILLRLLRTLESNLEGAHQHLDTEFLHQLRVATRRTRSVLSQVKGVLPSDQVEEFKAGFAWLQQVTGPVRDLDVYLLEFDQYREALPHRLQAALGPVRDFLTARLAAEQRALQEALESERLQSLLAQWRALLEAPVPERPGEPNAARPIKQVVSARVLRMAKRVRREGLAIQPSSPATTLHELRKSCKKLRYLMELFQSLYPQRRLARLLKLVKALLDHLGLVQDLAVQAEHLLDWAEQMRAQGEVETDTLLAMGALIGQLLERQQRARDDFAAVFDHYVHDDHQALFRELFGPT